MNEVTPENTELVPLGGTDVVIRDGIISAQKVAVRRDEESVLRKLSVLGKTVGEKWFYRYPVKDHGSTKWIEGPSIKLANDLARIYGNCQVDVRALDEGDHWMFYARFVDVETGFSLTRAWEQAKDAAALKTKDANRKKNIAFQIGQSKAIRNVVVNALQSHADYAFEMAKDSLIEQVGKNLGHYRGKVLGRLEDLNIKLKVVESAVGKPAAKWLAPDVTRVIAELQAIGDGMATVEETYPAIASAGEAAQKPQTSAKEPAGQEAEEPASASEAAQEPEEEPKELEWAVINTDGEEADCDDAQTFVLALTSIYDDCASVDALKGMRDTNSAMVDQLREHEIELAQELLEIFQRRLGTLDAAAQEEANQKNVEHEPDTPAQAEPEKKTKAKAKPKETPTPAAASVELLDEKGKPVATHQSVKAWYAGLQAMASKSKNATELLRVNTPGHQIWLQQDDATADEASLAWGRVERAAVKNGQGTMSV